MSADLTCNSANIQTLNATAMQVNYNLTVNATFSGLLNPGYIMMYAGRTGAAPSGWVYCDGTAYSITGTYAKLFNVIRYNFGGVTGTNFRVPNLLDRFPRGTGSSSLGITGGVNTFTISENNLPTHTHDFSGVTASHFHDIDYSSLNNTNVVPTSTMGTRGNFAQGNGDAATGITNTTLFAKQGNVTTTEQSNVINLSGSTDNNSTSALAVNCNIPYINLSYIIKI
jgi:microcystin-dependent protein